MFINLCLLLIPVCFSGLRPRIGDLLECRGRLKLSDNVFEALSSDDNRPIISYQASSDMSSLIPANLTLTCPAGHEDRRIYEYTASNTTIHMAMLLFYCKACSLVQYNLRGSSIQLYTEAGQLKVDIKHKGSCQTCPYGANCSTSVIRARANYWGEVYNQRVYMHVCPEEYCCQSTACESIHECAPHRVGRLCGLCAKDYSEAMFSKECVHNSQCGIAAWLWVLIVLYGIFNVFIFVFQEEISNLIQGFSDWTKKHYNRCKQRLRQSNGQSQAGGKTGQQEEAGADEVGGDMSGDYLQIIMYYLQVTPLLKVKIIYESNREIPLESFQSLLQDVFSLSSFGITANSCLFRGVDAILKIWIKSGFILYLFVVWILMFTLGKCILTGKMVKNIAQSEKIGPRFFAAFVNLLLYTYQYFAENTFILLRCIKVQSLEKPVLFIEGNTQCYQDWQYGIFAFSAIYVFPFFLVLTFGPQLLKRRMISVKVFIISMLLPLFSTPILLFKFVKSNSKNKNVHMGQVGKDVNYKTGGNVDRVVEIVAEPYRSDIGGGLCWEGMIALRRLVLVLISTLVTTALYRHLGLMLACFLIMATHIRVHPFISTSSNKLETLSLGTLLLVSIMNLLKASYFNSGEIPKSAANYILVVWDWVELFLFVSIPVAVGGILSVAIILRLTAFILKRFKGAGSYTPSHGAIQLQETEKVRRVN